MKREEAIKYLRQIYPNGGHCWLDEQRIKALDMAIQALSVSLPEGLDEAVTAQMEEDGDVDHFVRHGIDDIALKYARLGAEWMEAQFEHCGTFPIEDPRGGYWPTDYYIKKK